MIVLEKRKDISILKTMGATEKDIQFIFVMEGILSALIGAGIGILLAIAICLLQMKYGFVKLGTSGSTFVVDAYPVVLKFSDVVLAFFTVVVISGLASFIPVSYTHLDVYKRQGQIATNIFDKNNDHYGYTNQHQRMGYTCLLYTSRCV